MHTHTHTHTHSILSEADTLASRSQTPGLLDDSFVVSNSEDRSALLQMLEEASCSSSDGGSEDEEIGEGGRHGG